MKPRREHLTRWTRWIGRAVVLVGFAGGVVLLMLWLAGKFEEKVSAGDETAQAAKEEFHGRSVPVRSIRLPRSESAMGTIRAVHEMTIGSRLLARVIEAHVKAGQKVRAGEVLLRLDDTDLRARLQQAKAALTSAEAVRAQAANDEKRYGDLVKVKAISRQEYERAKTAVQTAMGDVRRAEESIKEVQATLDYATIRSPIDATVIDKKVDSGDMVTPGQMLVTLFDPKRMQLVASVRESLAHRLQVGQDIPVQVEGLGKQCSGTVSEIVPEAQSSSRSFQVKVTGPCPTGIYTGMFGRILVPLDEEELLVIPRQAVRSVGQLELVEVVEDGRAVRRSIRTGRMWDDQVEVLSGLREGERVVVPAAAQETQEANRD